MSQSPSIQWFPGHMAKTRRLIKECLPLVDAVVEVRDSRIVLSSKNPEIDKLLANKKRILVLNKSDCSDTETTKKWCDYYKAQGIEVVITDSRSGKGINQVAPAVRRALKETLEKWQAKGMKTKALKVMVVGIPNVGKSSFINRIAGGKRAKVEDRPGVTRGKQWLTADKFELLDMPGVLWEKFSDMNCAYNLAYTGAIKDDVFDIEEVAVSLLNELSDTSPDAVRSRLGLGPEEAHTGYELLEIIAGQRGFLLKGGVPDTEKAAKAALTDLRGAGKDVNTLADQLLDQKTRWLKLHIHQRIAFNCVQL